MPGLLMIWRSPRPSKVGDMQAAVSRLWCRKGYEAVTVFGHIFTRTQEAADRLNSRFDALKNHEMIHLRQAQNTHNSWFLFYVLYLWHSLLALRYLGKTRNPAYYLNPFEIEAYCHMYDLHYLDSLQGEGASEWRVYARMSLAARLRYVRKNNVG